MPGDAPTEWLNESQFTGYHNFAATTRIAKDSATPQPQDFRVQPGRVQEVSPPADSNVTSKQKEEIPDEDKPDERARPPCSVA